MKRSNYDAINNWVLILAFVTLLTIGGIEFLKYVLAFLLVLVIVGPLLTRRT